MNVHVSHTMSFYLSFRSFQNQCSDGEKETSVRQIHLCDQMGDKHTNMFYHAFPCYVNNCTMQKRNGVSLLLLSEYLQCFFLSSKEDRG